MKYLDNKDEEIKKGFYIHLEYNALFYFTGKYDIEGFPIFEIEGGNKKRCSLYSTLINQLSKLDKENLEEEKKESKERKSWIERKLKN
jgi:hypothetical protein